MISYSEPASRVSPPAGLSSVANVDGRPDRLNFRAVRRLPTELRVGGDVGIDASGRARLIRDLATVIRRRLQRALHQSQAGGTARALP